MQREGSRRAHGGHSSPRQTEFYDGVHSRLQLEQQESIEETAARPDQVLHFTIHRRAAQSTPTHTSRLLRHRNNSSPAPHPYPSRLRRLGNAQCIPVCQLTARIQLQSSYCAATNL